MEMCKTCGLPYKLYKPYMGEMCNFGGDHAASEVKGGTVDGTVDLSQATPDPQEWLDAMLYKHFEDITDTQHIKFRNELLDQIANIERKAYEKGLEDADKPVNLPSLEELRK